MHLGLDHSILQRGSKTSPGSYKYDGQVQGQGRLAHWLGAHLVLHNTVLQVAVYGDSSVGGQGPGRGRPHGQGGALQVLPGIRGHAASKLHKRHAHVHAARGVALRILELLQQKKVFTSFQYALRLQITPEPFQDQLGESEPLKCCALESSFGLKFPF